MKNFLFLLCLFAAGFMRPCRAADLSSTAGGDGDDVQTIQRPIVVNNDYYPEQSITSIVPKDGKLVVKFADGSTQSDVSFLNVGLIYKANLNGSTSAHASERNAETLRKLANRRIDEVTIKRNIKRRQWNTICLPFDMSASEIAWHFGKETRVASFTSQPSANILNFTSCDSIKAGEPYIIWPTGSWPQDSCFTFSKVLLKNIITPGCVSSEEWTLQGTIAAPFNNNGYNVRYIADGNELMSLSSNGTIAPFRAYLKSASESSARKMMFTVDGISTGILNIDADGKIAPDTKGVYSLNGQYLGTTTRNLPEGIYIVNGKNVLVKH